MTLNAVLFDMDGVLIDSMPHHLAAFNEVLSPFGKCVALEQIAGRSTAELMNELLGKVVSGESLERLCLVKSSQARNTLRRAGKELLMPGIEQLLQMLPPSTKRGICTSASEETVSWLLADLLYGVEFDCVITSAQVKKSKPDPEVYRMAAATLGVSPGDCLVIEDSLHGIMAGYLAGCVVAHFAPEKSISCECVAHHHIWQLTDVVRCL